MADIVEIGGPFSFSLILPPTAAFTTVEQRTDRSFLVDAKFTLAKDGGHHQFGAFKFGEEKFGPDDYPYDINLVTAEFSTDGGNSWNTANPQSVDWRHTATSPMEATATPTEYDFVWNAFWDLPEDFEGYAILRFEFVTSGGSITTTITSSPFQVTSVVSVPPQESLRSRRRAFKIDDFLGEGPIAPWRRGPNDFMTARGAELIRSAVRMILATRAATDLWGGELEWDPGFGSLFWSLRHDQSDEIAIEMASGFAEIALEDEPRVVVLGSRIEIRDNPGGRAMYIKTRYRLITSNEPENRVFMADPEEVTVEVL